MIRLRRKQNNRSLKWLPVLALSMAIFPFAAQTQTPNPFDRTIIEPPVVEEPEEVVAVPDQPQVALTPILPNNQLQPQQAAPVINYANELADVQVVGVRNNTAVIRTPGKTLFLNSGELMIYNGIEYTVRVSKNGTVRFFFESLTDGELVEVLEYSVGKTLIVGAS